MQNQITVRWSQMTLSGTPLNRWNGSIESPRVIHDFASLNMEKGLWRLVITRQGKKPLQATYRSPEPAKRHLERWLQYHWQVVGGLDLGVTDPRGREGRTSGDRRSNQIQKYLGKFNLYD